MQRKLLNFGEVRQRKESLTAHKAKNEMTGVGLAANQINVVSQVTGRSKNTHSDFVDNFCNNNLSHTAPLDSSVISNQVSRRAHTPQMLPNNQNIPAANVISSIDPL